MKTLQRIGSFIVYTIMIALSGLTLSAQSAWSATVVKVGGYEFPPYVTQEGAGVTKSFIELMNAAQTEYEFVFETTSSQRRYKDMIDQKRYDIILFESLAWGWKDYPVDASKVFLTDSEVFIARKEPGVDQSYFRTLEGKKIVGLLGYHYAFAGFDANPENLKKKFNTDVTSTHQGNIQNVIAGHFNLAIVTKSFLSQFLKANPETAAQIIVSDRDDQVYEHTILVRRDAPITVAKINALLDALEKNGKLAAFWTSAGIGH